MSDPKLEGFELKPGFSGMAKDTASDQTMFKGVHWGKAMMWIFLLSDTFIFSCFLISYMKGRASTVVEWPNPSEVFALDFMGVPVPLLLIAIMTFVLITSSGTMALAVKYGYEKNNNSKKSALETKISKKFNQKGWFKCLMKNNTYNEIAFGKPINFESWMNYVQKGDIFFDSGMYQGNNRNYSQWRSVNSFWEELIEERYTKAI